MAVSAKFTQKLRAQKLLPLDFDNDSVSTLVSRVKGMGDVELGQLPTLCINNNYCTHVADIPRGSKFEALDEIAQSKCAGLCIDCVRAGGNFSGRVPRFARMTSRLRHCETVGTKCVDSERLRRGCVGRLFQ